MNGIIIINKPKNYTSNDIVQIVKKTFKEKVGHTGTLDPNATGVLPLLIGQGTKLSKYLINHDKIYDVVLKLGQKTDTADSEGKIIENKSINFEEINKENINNVFKSFIGKQKQIPPMYSAIKINGKKLYEYARNGQEIQIQPRNIEIYNLKLININEKKDEISFRVECSKGTYIRSLCEDIAEKLGTLGYMKELNRIKVGDFDITNAITIEQIKENVNNKEFLEKNFISIEKIFENKEMINLNNKKLELFLNGVSLKYELKPEIYRIYNENRFIGVGTINKNILKRDIIL